VEVVGLVEEVHVEVHVHAEGLGQAEHDVDVLDGVGVVVGAAPDQIGPHLQRSPQQALRRRRLDDALLGEGAELEVDRRRVLGLERQQGLHAGEAHDRVDLHVRPHRGGAGGHRQVQGLAGPGLDVVGGERALGLADQSDGLLDRRRRGRDPRRQQRLVQVDVGFDQAGREQTPAGLDRLADRGRARHVPRDAGNAALGHGDIPQPRVVGQATGPQE
jgi:hypothetical protein